MRSRCNFGAFFLFPARDGGIFYCARAGVSDIIKLSNISAASAVRLDGTKRKVPAMNDPPRKQRLTRPQLHRYEERLKYALRDQVAELASFLEVIISVLVLLGLIISAIPVAQEMLTLWSNGNTDAFQTFLGHAFNLVIGIEFIKMLAKHSPGSALEVLLYAIVRNMILGHGTAVENLLAVASIGLIFVIRKFCFVPAFGSTMPGGETAYDVEPLFGRKKPARAAESKDSPRQAAEAAETLAAEAGPDEKIPAETAAD